MRYDIGRLHHLHRVAKDRKAAYLASYDDRAEQREKIVTLQRDHDRLAVIADRDAEAKFASRMAAARAELEAMSEREAELAQASSTAGATFARALEHAQAEGLDLPEDLRPRPFGAAARGEREAAT